MKHEYHNPDNLTTEQVGKGYRLLLKSEVKSRAKPHKEMESFSRSMDGWLKNHRGCYGDNEFITYRVPLAAWPLPESAYNCPPVKHPEVQELQERFAKPEWISWHGGECPLKDEEVEEWEYKMRDGGVAEFNPPSERYWKHNDYPADIIAYRVLKWKKPQGQTTDARPVATRSEEVSLGRIAYDAFNKVSCNYSRTWELASDEAKKFWESAALAVKSECAKESAPTDNDAWNSLLATNAQLGKKVAELDSSYGDLKTTADVLQEFEGDTVHEQAQQAVRRISELSEDCSALRAKLGLAQAYAQVGREELQSKLAAAEARLKQLEWVPYSERKPTLEDADDCGYVVIANRTREWQIPWSLHPETASHWRPFAPPIIDNDEVDFENWYLKNGSSYVGVKKGNMRKIWKAAREVRP